MRIAVLDDEPIELQRIQQTLETVLLPDQTLPHLHLFSSGQSLTKALRQETFELLLLDWQVPDLSGIDVLKWAQEHLPKPPAVIMLTSRSDEQDVVQALNAGAADYVYKPFRPGELVARLRNVIRQRMPAVATNSTMLTFGDIVFDTAAQTVCRGDTQVQLAPREYQLAMLFFINLGKPLSRQYLYDHLWTRDEEFTSRSLDTHIYRIRTKLGLTAERGWMISTVYGYGYRLVQQEKAATPADR
jgi:two-component system response regulator TrcR